MSDVTRILSAIEDGDPKAAAKLLPLVYAELRKLAARKLAREQAGQTLDPTALVHEAYLRLIGNQAPNTKHEPPQWNSRGHFYAAAAEAMRRILIENARRKSSKRHGGKREAVDLAAVPGRSDSSPDDWLLLDEALTRLEGDDADAAAIAKLRLFAGLSVEQAAKALDLPRATAFRYWTYARAWLNAQLRDDGP